jgi:hypothetical protein
VSAISWLSSGRHLPNADVGGIERVERGRLRQDLPHFDYAVVAFRRHLARDRVDQRCSSMCGIRAGAAVGLVVRLDGTVEPSLRWVLAQGSAGPRLRPMASAIPGSNVPFSGPASRIDHDCDGGTFSPTGPKA